MGVFPKLFGGAKMKASSPVPDWEPDIPVPIEKIVDQFQCYTRNGSDFVVFKNGTCAQVMEGLTESRAAEKAVDILSRAFNHDADMRPLRVSGGNILLLYNFYPVANLVLEEVTSQYMDVIRANYMRALTPPEASLITSEKFDDFKMKALFGRCYFFMDAKKPQVFGVFRSVFLGLRKPRGPAFPNRG